jgi:hypothetical protein
MPSRLARAASALLLGGLAVAGARPASAAKHDAPRAAALPFIEDDFAGALEKAKASGRPLFVEVWAPW